MDDPLRLSRHELLILGDVVQAAGDADLNYRAIMPAYRATLAAHGLAEARDQTVWSAVLRLKRFDGDSWREKYDNATRISQRSPVSRHRRYESEAGDVVPRSRSAVLQRLDTIPDLAPTQKRSNRKLTYHSSGAEDDDAEGECSADKRKELFAAYRLHAARRRIRLLHRCVAHWHGVSAKRSTRRQLAAYEARLIEVEGVREEVSARQALLRWRRKAVREHARKDHMWRRACDKDEQVLLKQSVDMWRARTRNCLYEDWIERQQGNAVFLRRRLRAWRQSAAESRHARRLASLERRADRASAEFSDRQVARTARSVLSVWQARTARLLSAEQRVVSRHTGTVLRRWLQDASARRLIRAADAKLLQRSLHRWSDRSRARHDALSTADTQSALHSTRDFLQMWRVRVHDRQAALDFATHCFESYQKARLMQMWHRQTERSTHSEGLRRVADGKIVDGAFVVWAEKTRSWLEMAALADDVYQKRWLGLWRDRLDERDASRDLEARAVRFEARTLRRAVFAWRLARSESALRRQLDSNMQTDVLWRWRLRLRDTEHDLDVCEKRLQTSMRRRTLRLCVDRWRQSLDRHLEQHDMAIDHDRQAVLCAVLVRWTQQIERVGEDAERADRVYGRSMLLKWRRARVRRRDQLDQERLAQVELVRGARVLLTWLGHSRRLQHLEQVADEHAREIDRVTAGHYMRCWRERQHDLADMSGQSACFELEHSGRRALSTWADRLGRERDRHDEAEARCVNRALHSARARLAQWRDRRRARVRQRDHAAFAWSLEWRKQEQLMLKGLFGRWRDAAVAQDAAQSRLLGTPEHDRSYDEIASDGDAFRRYLV